MDKEKKISIAVIAASALLAGIVFAVDYKDISLSSIIDSTGIKDVFAPIKELEGTADKLKDEMPLIEQELENEMNGNEDMPSLFGTLVEVEDCSTYILQVKGKDTRYRLIGVSIIEETKEQALSALRDKLAEEDIIFIEYDAVPADEYGRNLAYLYMASGEMIQEWLISNGYAVYVSDEVNTAHEAELLQTMSSVKE